MRCLLNGTLIISWNNFLEEDFTAVSLRHHEQDKVKEVESLVSPALRHTDQEWSKVDENEPDIVDDETDHGEMEEFPPPPPPIAQTAAEVKTVKLGEPLKFKLNLQVADGDKLTLASSTT